MRPDAVARELRLRGGMRVLEIGPGGGMLTAMVTVLGEVPNRAGALRECRRVLTPDGRLVIGEALPDPDYIPGRRLVAEAARAGLMAGNRVGPWFSYTRDFGRGSPSDRDAFNGQGDGQQ